MTGWKSKAKSNPLPKDAALPWVFFCGALILYANALQGSFVQDDLSLIQNNPTLQFSLSSLFNSFVTPYWDGTIASNSLVYRPLAKISYILTHALVGNQVWLYHLTNHALHGIASVLVFKFVLEVYRTRLLALLAALFFLVHPIHVDAVACISNRTEMLAACFGLYSLLLFLRGRSIGSSIAFFLALLSKESAVTLLPTYFLLAYALKKRLPRSFLIGTTLSLAFYFILRKVALGNLVAGPEMIPMLDNPLAQGATLFRIFTAFQVFWRNVTLLVAPLQLSPDYSYPQIPPPSRSLASRAVGGCFFARSTPRMVLEEA